MFTASSGIPVRVAIHRECVRNEGDCASRNTASAACYALASLTTPGCSFSRRPNRSTICGDRLRRLRKICDNVEWSVPG